jgi:hypothetical protein
MHLWRDVPAKALRSRPTYGSYDYNAAVCRLRVNEVLPDLAPAQWQSLLRLQHLVLYPRLVRDNEVVATRVLERFGPTLASVTVDCLYSDCFSECSFGSLYDDFFLAALTRDCSSLVRVYIGTCISGASDNDNEMVLSAFWPTVFGGRLQHFTATIRSRLVPDIVKALPAVNMLELCTPGWAAPVLPAVAQLRHLSILRIQFAGFLVLSSADTLALCALSQPRVLSPLSCDDMWLKAPTFGDSECVKLAACLPQLHEWDVARQGFL